MRRPSSSLVAAFVLGLIVLLLLFTYLFSRGDADQDKLDRDDLAAAEAGVTSKCGSQRVYELIKREIFRQAADTRGSEMAAFDRIAAGASVRMERPIMQQRDPDGGRLDCSGALSIDLPPGLAVVGGRRTLTSTIDYVVQPAADGSGDVVMIQGADSIIVPLATLASVRRPTPPEGSAPAVAGTAFDTAGGANAAQTLPPATTPKVPGARASQPSFNCRFARTRGEIAVCRDAGLAALDRQMASQYVRAAAAAEPRRQAVLRATRDAFLRYRDSCQSHACIAGAYRDRMREIDDIMAGRWRPGR